MKKEELMTIDQVAKSINIPKAFLLRHLKVKKSEVWEWLHSLAVAVNPLTEDQRDEFQRKYAEAQKRASKKRAQKKIKP